MAMNPTAVPTSTESPSLVDVRRSVTYQPTIWGDYFLACTPEITKISSFEKQEQRRQKDLVRELLEQTLDDSPHKLGLIDAIQRLGVGYHFEKEINISLRNIHNTSTLSKYDNDLHVVALHFRLLRQHGYNLSCDVFNIYIDHQGDFKESLADDIEGMLSLYEAAHFGVQGERILDKALEFSSSRLKSLLNQMSEPHSSRVNKALKSPIRKTVTRLGARNFISMYQEDDSHKEILLNFAKLDFNIVQKVHQMELYDITRWSKDLDLAKKLPFARERLAECYLWIMEVYCEPQWDVARIFFAKVIYLASKIDDIYDVYGTLDDLHLFTKIIQSWDVDALDQLPPYMRICYKALLDVYEEMEDEVEKLGSGSSYRVQYAKDEMKKMVRAYMEEAKWFYTKYTPTMEEYMKVALVSGAGMMLAITSMVGMGDSVTKQEFDWISNEPLIIRASSIISRLLDDMVGHGFESKLTAVQCYMSQNGASEMEARTDFQEQVKRAWKDMNKECLQQTTVSSRVLMNVVNLSRVVHLLYSDEDEYTNPKPKVKDYINCVLVEPVAFDNLKTN